MIYVASTLLKCCCSRVGSFKNALTFGESDMYLSFLKSPNNIVHGNLSFFSLYHLLDHLMSLQKPNEII